MHIHIRALFSHSPVSFFLGSPAGALIVFFKCIFSRYIRKHIKNHRLKNSNNLKKKPCKIMSSNYTIGSS